MKITHQNGVFLPHFLTLKVEKETQKQLFVEQSK
jgi:hypothetical protein